MLTKETLHFALKLSMTIAIIVGCSQIAKRLPTLAGLIATAPITTLIVLLWVWTDNPGDYTLMQNYSKGVLWGIIPSTLFFGVALLCFYKRMSIYAVLAASSFVWLAAAAVHQWLLGKH